MVTTCYPLNYNMYCLWGPMSQLEARCPADTFLGPPGRPRDPENKLTVLILVSTPAILGSGQSCQLGATWMELKCLPSAGNLPGPFRPQQPAPLQSPGALVAIPPCNITFFSFSVGPRS